MLYGTLKHLESYRGIHPGVMRGLELLRDTDFTQMEDGRYEVDGDRLFYSLQSYVNKPANDTPESHRKYIDIQFLISGREWMDVAPLENMTEVAEARPEGDIWLHRGRWTAGSCWPGTGSRCSGRRMPTPPASPWTARRSNAASAW